MRYLFTIRHLVPTLACAALLCGCGEQKKVKECNAFVTVINAGVDKVQKGAGSSDGGSSVAELRNLATEMDAIAAQTNQVELTLPELQEHSKNYAAMATEVAGAARELAAAVDAVDMEKMNQAQKRMQSAVGREGPLIDGINKFCRAP